MIELDRRIGGQDLEDFAGIIFPVHDIDTPLGQHKIRHPLGRAQAPGIDGFDLQFRSDVEANDCPGVKLDFTPEAVRRQDGVSRSERGINDGRLGGGGPIAPDRRALARGISIDKADMPVVEILRSADDLIFFICRQRRRKEEKSQHRQNPATLSVHSRSPGLEGINQHKE